MDEHLGYQKSERSDSDDYRNGHKEKQINSSYCKCQADFSLCGKHFFQ
jgi:putative transposase